VGLPKAHSTGHTIAPCQELTRKRYCELKVTMKTKLKLCLVLVCNFHHKTASELLCLSASKPHQPVTTDPNFMFKLFWKTLLLFLCPNLSFVLFTPSFSLLKEQVQN